jgi:hypothetical protein
VGSKHKKKRKIAETSKKLYVHEFGYSSSKLSPVPVYSLTWMSRWLVEKMLPQSVSSTGKNIRLGSTLQGKDDYNVVFTNKLHQTKEDPIEVEYRAVSCVFQNIDPPLPSPPGECVLSPQQRRGVHTRRTERGVGGQYFGRRET